MKRRNIVLIIGIITILMSMSIFTYVTNYIYTQKEEKEEIKGKENKLYHSQGYNEIRELIYPVGSIYMSVEDDTVAKVEERFGGEWEVFAAGRTIVAMGNNGTTNYTQVEKTDGNESQSYTPAGTVGNTTLTAAQTGIREHTHGYTQATYKFTGTRAATEGGGSHTHTLQIKAQNGTVYTAQYGAYFEAGSSRGGINFNNSTTNGSPQMTTQANHSHYYTPSGSVTITGNASVTKVNAANATSAHNHSFTGTAATISHMQPYITVYMYKRTA